MIDPETTSVGPECRVGRKASEVAPTEGEAWE